MIDSNYFRYLKGYTLKHFKYLGGRGAVPGLTLQEEANLDISSYLLGIMER